MLQFGRLCATCKPGRCMDCPTTLEPALVQCSECGGNGCSQCNDRGEFELTSCPNRYIGRDTADVLQYVGLCEKGLPPVAGGALDQSAWFIDAMSFVSNERAIWRAALGISNG